MAKRRKALPGRKLRDRSRDDDSVLLRSAESLGRLIGLLQRQLDSATKRLATGEGSPPVRADSRNGTTRRTRRKATNTTTRKSGRKAATRTSSRTARQTRKSVGRARKKTKR
jgi:hypothetical protein